MEKKNLVRTSVGLVRISLCTEASWSCARALCAGLVRKGLCAVVRTAYDGCARVCARDLVRKPCARAFLALPTLRNTKACAYRTAQLSGGVCATRFAAAQLLHN